MQNNMVCENRKARHDYFIEDTIEAGIKLTGTEIKSIRAHKVNINDAYVMIRNNKVEIINMHIANMIWEQFLIMMKQEQGSFYFIKEK